MATMSDDGEKTCPLCAEEMDLTDQQLKPCKCGYEICVWCWHHIMEMAEKEDLEGRCPACRKPYDKERIVGMAANCERVVAEINADRKNKSQKTKLKTSIEARKHLNGVRVVKRNLVYITGLPSNLADESILERKEYFGQYGKVLKVSISRTANTTAVQQASSNNTFSVYITYAREEEAIRCIQAVHNFTLEGKPLRACFGTTKYCHTWLRNMTCSNPDCLYLHDIGSQEDSFTKDEIISAYTRGRVPQSASNNLQRCSGNVLPPPLDDWCSDGEVSGKHLQKSASNTTVSQVKGSPSISNGGRSTVLPAAASWGSRVTSCRPPAASMACMQNPVKHKPEMLNSSSSLSSIVASTKQTSAWHDDAVTSKIPEVRNMVHMNHKSRPMEPIRLSIGRDTQTTASDVPSEANKDPAQTFGISAWSDDATTLNIHEGVQMEGRSKPVQPLRPFIGRDNLASVLDVSAANVLDEACPSAWDDDVVIPSQIPLGRDCQTTASDMSSAGMNAFHTSGISISCSSTHQAPAPPENKNGGITVPRDNTNLVHNLFHEGPDRGSSSFVPDRFSGGVTVNENVENICSGLASMNVDSYIAVDHPSMDQHQISRSNCGSTGILRNLVSNLQQTYPEQGVECLASTSCKNSPNPDLHVTRGFSDWNSEARNVIEDALVAADDQRHNLSHAINESSSLANEHHPLNISNRSSDSFWSNDASKTHFSSANGDSRTVDIAGKRLLSSRDNGPVISNAFKEDYLNSSAILGNVFEGPITNTKKEAKILGRFDDLPKFGKTTSVDMGESNIITDILALDFDPWGDSLSPANDFAKLIGEREKQAGSSKVSSSWKSQHSSQSRFSFARQESQASLFDTSFRSTVDAHKICSSSQDPYGDGFQIGSQINSFEGSNGLQNRNTLVSSDKTAGVSRAKISAPPGFRVPNRAPPPGFSSHDRYDRAYEMSSDNHQLPVNPSILNQYQAHSAGNAGDVEFIDPAILAVGKGILPFRVNSSGLVSRSAFPSQLSPSDSSSAFPSQFSHSDSDPRLVMKQQSIPTHQDQRIPENVGYRFMPLNEGYISPGLLTQNHSRQPQFAQMSHQQPRPTSHVPSGQWDGWNGFDMGMSEILRNNRFGL